MDLNNDSSEGDGSSSAGSSLLSMLQGKLRRGLQPTQTKVTLPTGEVNFYEQQGQEKLANAKLKHERSCGFVVDTKPDMTVGKVLPWLLITSQDVPQELSMIENLGVTHILSLLPGFELCSSVKAFIREHNVLEIYDEETFSTCPSTCTTDVMSEAVEFIDKVKRDSGVVLVHCNAGISRAPTIVMFYLIRKEGYSFEDAWKAVVTVRPGAKPNSGFLNFLRNVQ